jgi:beta-aspartyl-dipeptidase (metallo-type)
MLTALVIRGARVWGPEAYGVTDVLVVGEQVAALGQGIEPPAWTAAEEIDAHGLDLIPGLIDQHVHIAGGGGEGGPINRTPEIMLSDLTRAGITTVVGVLGTDGSTRHVQGLLAKARQLTAEGITAYIYTGAYEVPTRTITENPRTDIVLIDRVVGVGEIAISDHRGTHPSDRELAHLAGEARVGGLLGGKAGVLHLHVGNGRRRLAPLRAVVEIADVPREGLVPTHLNRNGALLEEALEWARAGGFADLTSDIRPDAHDPEAIAAHDAALWLTARGVPWDRISFSSDAQGSSPTFDAAGHLVRMDVARAHTLFDEMAALVRAGLSWPDALRPVTTTPAHILKLDGGRIQPGGPADLVVVDDLAPRTVIARGRVMVRDGRPVVLGRFERVGE